MQPDRKIWFPAKKYGWGWGPPRCWQGWVVLLGWLAIIEVGAFYLIRRSTIGFYVFIAVMTALLITVCWAKGEKPRWRWGEK